MKKKSLTLLFSLFVVFLAGLAAADIQVAPEEYDFGDVEVATPSTTIITVSNVASPVLWYLPRFRQQS